MIIGANLGTTITAWLLALNAIDGQSLLMTILKPSNFSPTEKLLGMIHDFDNADDKLTESDRREIRILGQAIYEILQLTIRGYNAGVQNVSHTIRFYTE